jgi:hypothetical protein
MGWKHPVAFFYIIIMKEKVYVSAKLLKQKDLSEMLKFSYFADKDQFKKTFFKHGIIIHNEFDLPMLEEMSSSGADINGAIRTSDTGERIVFSVINILGEIHVNNNMFKKSNIEIID